MLAFSAASPAAALLSWLALAHLPGQGGAAVPLAVLFSGGTVLYAATAHILPSALGHSHHGHHSSGTSSDTGTAAGATRRPAAAAAPLSARAQLLLLSAGMLAPLLLSAVFHHEH